MEEQKVERTEEPVRAHQPVNSESRSSSKESHHKRSDGFWKVTTVVLIVILAFFAFRSGNPTGGTVVDTIDTNGNNVAAAPPARVAFQGVIDKDDPVKGDEDAPVTIIEWSDFECPFCARFYTETFGQIDEQYIKTGKVRLVYKDFPLSFHTQAQKAAEAAECADEQGKFWEMHDLLFEQGVQGGVTGFKAFAKQLNLDQAKFDKCLDSGEQSAEIKKDMADGGKSGIQGTPGFLINGVLVSGAQPFTVFQQVIDAELS